MMRRSILALLLLLYSGLSAANIAVKMASSPCKLYLASYYGNGMIFVDSLTQRGEEAIWYSREPLKEGVYFITDSAQSGRFEFLVGKNQDIDIEMINLSSNVGRITGADESVAFADYQRFVEDPNKRKEEKTVYTRVAYEKAQEGSVLKLVLKAMLSPPSQEVSSSLLVVNTEKAYDYNVTHYWDNFDLSDERLVRTPFFAKRVEVFLRQVLLPREDKIMEGMMPLLERAEQNVEVLRIVAQAALSYAVENSIMGIDALGYELISRYYLTGRLGILSSQQMKMLEDYVKHTEHCRVGHQGQEIRLDAWVREKGEVSLFETEAPYVVLLFWEPDCDYCKVVVPILRDQVFAKFRDKGLQVFAVNTQRDYNQWNDYIIDNELYDWIHGYRANGVSDFMVNYGVQGTPYIYILDKDKKIVAKNVKLDFIDVMLERLFASGSIY